MLRLRLSRRWLRQILKLVFGILVLVLTVFFIDLYYNIIPTLLQSQTLLQLPDHVLVDIKIETCRLQSNCPTTRSDWSRIPKDLYLNLRWGKHGYLYEKSVTQEQLTPNSLVVLDAAVSDSESNTVPAYIIKDIENEKVRVDPNAKPIDQAISIGWEKRPYGLWVKRGMYNPIKTVTSVNVLYGPDAVDPRDGWFLRAGYISGIETPGPRLSLRVGPEVEKKTPELRVRNDGKLRILQLADLHFSTGVGRCRDLYPEDVEDAKTGCSADPRTLKFVEKVLDSEKPDYVVLTGDQIFGETAPDAETAMLKAVAPLISRKIPYSMVLGNHDDDTESITRRDLMLFVSDLPYSLSELGSPDISGYGNYVQQALAPSSDKPALTFYFLDSHSNSPNPKLHPGYAWIEQNQLYFVQSEYERLKPRQDAYSNIHMSMAFFHIPFPEYASKKPFVGKAREPITSSSYNTGVRDVLAKVGVSVVSIGHDHVNDYCMFHNKGKDEKLKENQSDEETALWLCYGGGVGEGGYGGYGGYERRVRLFDIDTKAAVIKSYKLLHEDPTVRLDEQILVKDGKAVYTL